ncbi:hypothetical protein BDW22DRAFT_1001253 [Trametopsis cervina]|nr:hypothetical protein BDW22DRAFT_1001253 [Trametopsis cervina]
MLVTAVISAFATLSFLVNVIQFSSAQIELAPVHWKAAIDYVLYIEAGSRTLLATISQATHDIRLRLTDEALRRRIIRGSRSTWAPRSIASPTYPSRLGPYMPQCSLGNKYGHSVCSVSYPNGTTFGFLATATSGIFATATISATQNANGTQTQAQAFPAAGAAYMTAEVMVVIGFILALLVLLGVVMWVDISSRKGMVVMERLEFPTESSFSLNDIDLAKFTKAAAEASGQDVNFEDAMMQIIDEALSTTSNADIDQKITDMDTTRQAPADNNEDTTLGNTATHASTSTGPSSSSSESLVSEEIHTVSEDLVIEWDEVLNSVPAFSTPARVRRGSAPPVTPKARFTGPSLFSREVLAVEGDEASSSTKKKKKKTKKKVSDSDTT